MNLNWIDAHAPAVQALAAIATLVVTIALAALTARYVQLTRTIARASAEQVQSMRETITASRRQHAAAVAEHAARLRAPLAELTPQPPNHDRLFHYAHLTAHDISTLEMLARAVDAETIRLAGASAAPLFTIDGFITRARAIPLSQGWLLSNVERQQWYDAHQSALSNLDALIAHARAESE